jgi:predicted ArsR family transcriptional regulator
MIGDEFLAISVLTRLRLVILLHQSGGLELGQLAKRLAKQSHRLSAHLQLLQRRGIVDYRRQGSNGNPSFYFLTERGQQLAKLIQELA